jgi:hypothetical protein
MGIRTYLDTATAGSHAIAELLAIGTPRMVASPFVEKLYHMEVGEPPVLQQQVMLLRAAQASQFL